MKRIPYSEQLQDDRWKTKRKTILLRDHHKCMICGFEGNINNPLEVHHKYYAYPLNAWEYDDSALITLCFRCHSLVHKSIGYLSYANKNGELVPMHFTKCKRCGGSGYLLEYRHVEHGICFRCRGEKFEELISTNYISIDNFIDLSRKIFDILHREMNESRAQDIIDNVDRLFQDNLPDYRINAYNSLYKVAINGYKEAQYRIGALLLWKKASNDEDISVDKDAQEAFVWLSYAAMQGEIKAQMMLSVFFKIGLGVIQNATHSKAWESISCHNDDELALCSRLGYAVSYNFRSKDGQLFYANILNKLAREGSRTALDSIELILKAENEAREKANQ